MCVRSGRCLTDRAQQRSQIVQFRSLLDTITHLKYIIRKTIQSRDNYMVLLKNLIKMSYTMKTLENK